MSSTTCTDGVCLPIDGVHLRRKVLVVYASGRARAAAMCSRYQTRRKRRHCVRVKMRAGCFVGWWSGDPEGGGDASVQVESTGRAGTVTGLRRTGARRGERSDTRVTGIAPRSCVWGSVHPLVVALLF